MEHKKIAFTSTLHCLTGCSIGEVLGMVIGAHFNIHDFAAVALSVFLAFLFGYSFTLIPLLSHLNLKKALALAFASDTVSISVMEVTDNVIMLLIPGAMDAGIVSLLFWGSLVFSLLVAFIVTFPVNYYLIARGQGHAVIHSHHH